MESGLPAAGGTAEISVVVPYFDNQHDLDLLLAGLTVQTHPPTRIQVVIADDGSPVPPQIPELAAGLDVCIVRQDDHGFRAGPARNLGVTQCDGQVLLFLDGDTVPGLGYVAELARLPNDVPETVVSGRRRYADLSTWTTEDLLTWFAGGRPAPAQWDEPDWLTNEYQRSQNLSRTHPRSYRYLIGAVLGCSRELFDEIGGFDETITGYGGEDYDFTYRAYNAGAAFAYVPEAIAWHDGRDWFGRTRPEEQTGQKNREVMMLAERIPDPSMRGHGQSYPVVDVIVTVHPDGWPLGAAVLCLRSLLTELDCGVWIDGTTPSSDTLRACFREDHRVRSMPFDPLADQYLAARARLQMTVLQPVTADETLGTALISMLEEDLPAVSVTSPAGVLLTVRSSRSLFRGARSANASPYTLSCPTGMEHSVATEPQARTLDHGSVGLQPIKDEPRLAAVFGGYA